MGCCGKNRPPNIAAKVAHAASAVGRIVKAKLRGETIEVAPDAFADRVAACGVCEFARHFPGAASRGGDFLRCDHPSCGCAINGPVRCKACLTTEKCPEGKWE